MITLTDSMRQAFEVLPDAEPHFYVSAEDGEPYDVCLLRTAQGPRVLKRAKQHEAEIYQSLLAGCPCVPHLYDCRKVDGEVYLLLEQVKGQPATRLDRRALSKILDALIRVQDKYWQDVPVTDGFGYETALASRQSRGQYLGDETLERAYAAYLTLFEHLPRTLCHDDLLPFNVLVSDTGATLIDWEVAGVLAYPTCIARLLAHAQESPEALFYISEQDKAFAIDEYYNRLIRPRGIPYTDYRLALDHFFLYEYAEWIMLEHKFGGTDPDRYRRYLSLAQNIANSLNTNKR